MADLSRTIQIIFDAVDNTGDVFKGLLDGAEKFTAEIESLTAPFATLTKDILAVEAGVTALGVAFATSAVKEAGTFNQAMTEIGTLFNAMPEDVERLKEEVLAFATSSTSSIPEITEAMYAAISATGDWENATKFLAEAEQLAVAGATDLKSSVDLLTTVMGAYGAKTDEAGRYSDALFMAVQLGKTTVEEMAGSLGRVAAAAAAGNVDIETLSAALAALTVSAGSTEQATTMLGALLKELSKPSEDLKAALGGLSLETDGLAPIMKRLMEVTGGSQAEMNRLFGSVEAANGALILARDSSGKFAEALEKAKDITGITAEAYKAMVNEFDNVNQMLVNSVSVVLIEVGDKIKEGYASIVTGITEIFKALGSEIGANNGAFDPILEYFQQKAVELGELFKKIAAALPEALDGLDWTGLINSFEGLEDSIVKALRSIFGEVNLTSPEGLRSVIQTIIDALAKLNEATGGIIEGFDPFLKGMGELFQLFMEMDPETIRGIGEGLGSLTALNEISGGISEAVGVLQALAGVLGILTAGGIVNGIRTLAATIGIAGAAGAGTTLVGAVTALGGLGPVLTAIAAAWAAWEIGKYIDNTTDLGAALRSLIGTTEAVKAPVESSANAVENASTAMKEAEKESESFRLAMEKLATDERLKEMEFAMKLDIAQVQANAEVAKAAFESLSTTITSTGDLLGKLYGLLVDPNSAGYVTQILEQIEKENAAREAAFKAQQDWFQANIDYLTAKTDRIKSEEALIQIDGAGLQPHLEAFMFEILAAIQVRLNEEGLELLTGLDAPLPAPA